MNARDEDGWTPLMYAAKYHENSEIIAMLLRAGANGSAIGKYDDLTPLLLAAESNPNLEVITMLLKAATTFTRERYHDDTELLLAARSNENPEVIIELLRAGADARAKNNQGKVALDYAKENTDAYRILEEASGTHFFELVKTGTTQDVKTALENGAFANAHNEENFGSK